MLREFLAILLSLGLLLFLADGLLSLADDSLILLLQSHALSVVRNAVAPMTLLIMLGLYMLIGLTPAIPRRIFLPIAFFHLVAGLAALPFLIYAFERIQLVVWAVSLLQVLLGLAILHRLLGGFGFRWPLVTPRALTGRLFTWRHSGIFVLVNLLLVLPLVVIYLGLWANRAVHHFSDGFVALTTEGLKMEARKYVREDGKSILLLPMSHIGERDYYQRIAKSFTTNSIILAEGVTDRKGLLTNKLSYERLASSLGVAEQQKMFPKPERTNAVVPADVDVEEFARSTIDFLNFTARFHARGLDRESALQLLLDSGAHSHEDLIDDILHLRNERVLEEIGKQLQRADHLVVPWGAAHMPGIARGIQALGFRPTDRTEYVAIRFRGGR